jgi:NADPH:quinone reductase-like Zn-dependent oxidoreductase
MIAESMRAVVLRAAGGPEQLVYEQVATPVPRHGEALVRVHAAALTRDELEWPVDRLPAIPSYEVSGVVEELGPAVSDITIGDEVYALTPFDRDGAAAEYVVVPAALLSSKPGALSHVESAALPMPGLTAWQGLFEHGGLEAGQRVLIHGASGGVGRVAAQLAAERGAEVVEMSSAEAASVDLVFDTVGGDLLRSSEALVRPGGRVVSVAEEPPEPRRPDISTSYFVVEPSGEQLAELARLADSGKLQAAVDSVFPLTEARAAFERVQARGKAGKVVLQP